MDRVQCAHCGVEHDLNELEPSFDRPDAYFLIPTESRRERTMDADAACVIYETDDAPRRHFLRVMLPIPVRGETEPFCWGVWVEVDDRAFARTNRLWGAADQASEPPFRATLANMLPGLAPSLGLHGEVRLTGPNTVPSFRFADGVDHPLAHEQRQGVYPERVLEWLAPLLHL
jgi:hypothetical protein